MRRVLIIAVTIALVAGLGYTAYTRLYLPSTRPILNGAPLVLPGKLEKLSADPLGSQPEPDQQRFAAVLHDAAASIEPGFRVDAEELYVRTAGGYDSVALRKMASSYLDQFGFVQSVSAEADVGGHAVDYLVWRPDWLHSVVDDRIVLAVMFGDQLSTGTPAMVFGYFVLRPR
ncbi:hypothetical protein [Mycolicibacterium iranicum]|uniref:Uncharacterized protein n=1 Tax=Mycolicibacterium iranicum TaxID=912594 RepID=A0A178LZH4_MYCIR|nr:hypothetical protein [Mycolicibacterium iranicum]OAN39461.1 hypothetical protein A4X20_17420 [Mycolicibacterium iranicum]